MGGVREGDVALEAQVGVMWGRRPMNAASRSWRSQGTSDSLELQKDLRLAEPLGVTAE